MEYIKFVKVLTNTMSTRVIFILYNLITFVKLFSFFLQYFIQTKLRGIGQLIESSLQITITKHNHNK